MLECQTAKWVILKKNEHTIMSWYDISKFVCLLWLPYKLERNSIGQIISCVGYITSSWTWQPSGLREL